MSINPNMKILIECDTHRRCTNHDERKYLSCFHEVKRALNSSFPSVTILTNIGPIKETGCSKEGELLDEYAYVSINNPNQRIRYPRLGSFEVTMLYENCTKIIYSKLETGSWPRSSQVVERIKKLISTKSRSLRNIKKSNIIKTKKMTNRLSTSSVLLANMGKSRPKSARHSNPKRISRVNKRPMSAKTASIPWNNNNVTCNNNISSSPFATKRRLGILWRQQFTRIHEIFVTIDSYFNMSYNAMKGVGLAELNTVLNIMGEISLQYGFQTLGDDIFLNTQLVNLLDDEGNGTIRWEKFQYEMNILAGIEARKINTVKSKNSPVIRNKKVKSDGIRSRPHSKHGMKIENKIVIRPRHQVNIPKNKLLNKKISSITTSTSYQQKRSYTCIENTLKLKSAVKSKKEPRRCRNKTQKYPNNRSVNHSQSNADVPIKLVTNTVKQDDKNYRKSTVQKLSKKQCSNKKPSKNISNKSNKGMEKSENSKSFLDKSTEKNTIEKSVISKIVVTDNNSTLNSDDTYLITDSYKEDVDIIVPVTPYSPSTYLSESEETAKIDNEETELWQSLASDAVKSPVLGGVHSHSNTVSNEGYSTSTNAHARCTDDGNANYRDAGAKVKKNLAVNKPEIKDVATDRDSALQSNNNNYTNNINSSSKSEYFVDSISNEFIARGERNIELEEECEEYTNDSSILSLDSTFNVSKINSEDDYEDSNSDLSSKGKKSDSEFESDSDDLSNDSDDTVEGIIQTSRSTYNNANNSSSNSAQVTAATKSIEMISNTVETAAITSNNTTTTTTDPSFSVALKEEVAPDESFEEIYSDDDSADDFEDEMAAVIAAASTTKDAVSSTGKGGVMIESDDNGDIDDFESDDSSASVEWGNMDNKTNTNSNVAGRPQRPMSAARKRPASASRQRSAVNNNAYTASSTSSSSDRVSETSARNDIEDLLTDSDDGISEYFDFEEI